MSSQPEILADGNRIDTPLCVDLDGTLIKTDSLWESCAALIRKRPSRLLLLPVWLLAGRARLKHETAVHADLDVTLLPYRQDLIAFLKAEKSRGRRLILATAASRLIAEAVAAHLDLFDVVLASDQSVNLKGARKAELLCAEYHPRGFSYVGNSSSDLKVWKEAASAVTVDTPRWVVRKIPTEVPVEKQFVGKTRWLKALAGALRPHQWSKNGLVFVPIITSGSLLELSSWGSALLMFVAFSCVASGLYVFNDISDLSADRKHPRKRHRPFASGDLPLFVGAVLFPLLLAIGFGIGAAAGGGAFLLAYVVVSWSYSLKLKEFPLVDLFALAALYSLRLFAGGEVSGKPVSTWLLAYSSFLFLSLALLKRVAELSRIRATTRGYRAADKEILQSFGVGATFVSSTVLALYVQTEMIAEQYKSPEILWGIVPLLLLWQCRLWLATARGIMHDDPIVFAVKDWVSILIAICLGLVVAASLTGF